MSGLLGDKNDEMTKKANVMKRKRGREREVGEKERTECFLPRAVSF